MPLKECQAVPSDARVRAGCRCAYPARVALTRRPTINTLISTPTSASPQQVQHHQRQIPSHSVSLNLGYPRYMCCQNLNPTSCRSPQAWRLRRAAGTNVQVDESDKLACLYLWATALDYSDKPTPTYFRNTIGGRLTLNVFRARMPGCPVYMVQLFSRCTCTAWIYICRAYFTK